MKLLDRFSHFCATHDSVVGRLLSPKNCLFAWGIWTPSNTWFLGPTQVHNPNGSSIGSAIFAGLMILAERPSYSTCNNRPYLCRTVMRPHKTLDWFSQLRFHILLDIKITHFTDVISSQTPCTMSGLDTDWAYSYTLCPYVVVLIPYCIHYLQTQCCTTSGFFEKFQDIRKNFRTNINFRTFQDKFSKTSGISGQRPGLHSSEIAAQF